MLADVNGDGLSDIVGFKDEGVDVALSNGSSFNPPGQWISYFGSDGSSGQWSISNDVRTLADVNGDGFADIVGFGNEGVEVSLSNGSDSFGSHETWIEDFTAEYSNEWKTDNSIRLLADTDGDGEADVVGFGDDGVDVALSQAKSELRRNRD